MDAVLHISLACATSAKKGQLRARPDQQPAQHCLLRPSCGRARSAWVVLGLCVDGWAACRREHFLQAQSLLGTNEPGR